MPGLAASAYQYAPNGSPWQFSAGAGLSANGSVFTAGNPIAPDGVQVAFLQGASNMSQTIDMNAGVYSLSFDAAQRAGYTTTHYQVIEVLVDGAPVGTVNPVSTSYASYETSIFSLTAGPHTIEFAGLNPTGGDNTAFVDEVAINEASSSINDGSFATPALAAGTFQYTPGGSPWQFSAGTGVSSNGSGFTHGNPVAPDGTQVAFIQSTGSISQSVYMDAGTYDLTFEAAQRAGVGNKHYQEIEVLVDNSPIGTVTPGSSTYASYQTSNFTFTAGLHTIKLVGMNPLGGDNTALIDEVAIAAASSLGDGSFETPGLAAKTFQYSPDGSPWQFSGDAGVSSNGSSFTRGNPVAPDGTQVAVLQCNGSISQPVSMDAGTYGLSFEAAQRAGSANKHYQEINVLIDGSSVGTVTPSSSGYALYETSIFTVTAGTHNVEFLGMNPLGGDNTAFIDEVTLTAASLISDSTSAAPRPAANAVQTPAAATGLNAGGSQTPSAAVISSGSVATNEPAASAVSNAVNDAALRSLMDDAQTTGKARPLFEL
jgi:hypothetical protein